jgi:hypothetical protein
MGTCLRFKKSGSKFISMNTSILNGNMTSKQLDQWLHDIPNGNELLAECCGMGRANATFVEGWRAGRPFPDQQRNIRLFYVMHTAALSRAGDNSKVDYEGLKKKMKPSGVLPGGYQSGTEYAKDYSAAREFIFRCPLEPES